jgi:plastocyanin
MREGTMKLLRKGIPALALVAASAGLAACDDDDGRQAASAPEHVVAITASEAGKQTRLSVPKSVPAGLVTVELSNTGKAFHEAQLVRLDAGHTTEEALNVIAAEGAPSPDWIHPAGGTGPAPPGGSSSATQRLRPGRYIVYDAPFQNEGQGVKSGVAAFNVDGEDDGGELPKATAKIEAYEYGFRASGLRPGPNTVEFSNTGGEAHHVIAAPYKPGATLAEVRKAFTREQGRTEPPLDFRSTSSTARIDGGTKQTTELELDKPGRYALLCFVSDRNGGPPHVAQGMLAEITVR